MPSVKSELPAVLLLGIDTPIGLTIIRELGEHGVPVYGIAHSAQSIGLVSRYLSKGYMHKGGEDELISLINEIAEKDNVHYLMTVSEQRIVFLQNNRHRLKGIVALIPDESAMHNVLNKDRIYTEAQKIAIRTPVNYEISAQSSTAIGSFPVILKWANPNAVAALLEENNIALNKCEYCYSEQELDFAIARYRPIGQFPLLQGYCRGYGLGHMVYLHGNRPILCFQHKRIHEWPPEGGVSSLCESVNPEEHKELFQKSVELLQAIAWEGPAMVEYRFDEETGEAVLMEINGRFWGSLALAHYAGAHFAWTHYSVNVLKQIPQQPRLRYGIRCMFFIPELKRLLRLLFDSDKIQDKTLVFDIRHELSDFLRHYLKRQFFYVFQWRDPKPFLTDIWYASLGRFLS